MSTNSSLMIIFNMNFTTQAFISGTIYKYIPCVIIRKPNRQQNYTSSVYLYAILQADLSNNNFCSYRLLAVSGIFCRHECQSSGGHEGWRMAIDKAMNVLVVDDYKTMVRIVRGLMEQLGFKNSDEATDGPSALAKIRSKDYGLILSDWNMSPMSGYDLLKAVRAEARTKSIP